MHSEHGSVECVQASPWAIRAREGWMGGDFAHGIDFLNNRCWAAIAADTCEVRSVAACLTRKVVRERLTSFRSFTDTYYLPTYLKG